MKTTPFSLIIKRATECDKSIRLQITDIFVEGFYDNLIKFFTKDKTILKKAFYSLYVLDNIHVAMIENEVVGFIGCTVKNQSCKNVVIGDLIRYFGVSKGLLSFFFLKQNPIVKSKIEINEKTAIIDVVVIESKHKNQGIATKLIKYLLDQPMYDNYVLEVIQNNTPAYELYKKLGFKEVLRKKGSKRSGVDYFVYMRYEK